MLLLLSLAAVVGHSALSGPGEFGVDVTVGRLAGSVFTVVTPKERQRPTDTET